MHFGIECTVVGRVFCEQKVCAEHAEFVDVVYMRRIESMCVSALHLNLFGKWLLLFLVDALLDRRRRGCGWSVRRWCDACERRRCCRAVDVVDVHGRMDDSRGAFAVLCW